MPAGSEPSASRPGAVVWEGTVLSGRIDRVLDAARDAQGLAERRFLVDVLERTIWFADPGAVSRDQAAAARALGVDASVLPAEEIAPAVPAQAVLVPLVAPEGDGFLRLLWVGYEVGDAREGPDGLEAEARVAVREALEVAARFAEPVAPIARHRLAAAQPRVLSALRITGRSLGPAVLVSAISLWTRRSVRPGTAVTGVLAGDRIATTGDLAAKLDAAAHGRADVRRFLVPAADVGRAREALGARGRIEVVGVATVRELIAEALAPHPERLEPDEAVDRLAREARHGWYGWRWPLLREPLERLVVELPAARVDLRVRAWTLLGTSRRNIGRPEEALRDFDRALALARSAPGRRGVPDAPIVHAQMQRALALRQLARFGEAARAAAAAVALARRARLRNDLVHALGSAALIESSRGRLAAAEKLQREALALSHEQRPTGCVRSHAYLIETLARRGKLAGARAEHERALEHLRGVPPERRASVEAWVRTSWGGGLVTRGRDEEAIAVLDLPEVHAGVLDTPLPGIVARRHLGTALARSGVDRERGLAILAATPAAYGPTLAPHLVFLAHVNVLVEARLRIDLGAWNADIAGRTLVALRYLPTTRVAARWLAPSRRAITRNPGSAAALDQLIARCLALA